MSRERERELLKKILATGWLNNTISCEVEELLAQPEQEQEPVAWGYKKRVTYKPEGSEEEEIIPLYTSPPKRKPIEDGELEVWYSQHTWAMDKQEYMWGFRDAEKMHGIGGEPLSNEQQRLRAIAIKQREAHGIGGGE